jgi:hypothetical protein
MDRSSGNTEAKGLLFDADQILSSELYESKEDEDALAALPELQRELILAECVEKIKNSHELSNALSFKVHKFPFFNNSSTAADNANSESILDSKPLSVEVSSLCCTYPRHSSTAYNAFSESNLDSNPSSVVSSLCRTSPRRSSSKTSSTKLVQRKRQICKKKVSKKIHLSLLRAIRHCYHSPYLMIPKLRKIKMFFLFILLLEALLLSVLPKV